MQAELTPESFLLQRKTISFPKGLPAFEDIQKFVLISNEEEAPFVWLQAIEKENLAFITIDPFLIYTQYLPDISEEDVNILEIESEKDVFVLSIVNLKNNETQGITANLVSPIVINWKKRLGKQVILQNHMLYSVRHRIDQGTNS